MKICKKCGNEFPQSIVIDQLKHSLQNRIHCLNCVPFKSSRGKFKFLNLLTEDEKKVRHEKIKKRNNAKQKKWSRNVKNKKGDYPINLRRQERRQKIIDLLGGSCMVCGYSKTIKNLCFHHLFDKKFLLNIAEFRRPVNILLEEIKKCVLLCHNCHGEVHSKMVDDQVIKSKHKIVVDCIEKLWAVTDSNREP